MIVYKNVVKKDNKYYSLMNNGFYRLDNIIRVKKFKVLKEL